MQLPSFTPRLIWMLLGAGATALAASSVILTEWLHLNPCPLCIFQRLLFMVIALLAFIAASGLLQRTLGVGIVLLSGTGFATASYQSWLQAQPHGSISCLGGEPNLVERLVYYLSDAWPALFQVSGFCEDKELVIFGLSLANWAVLCFAAGVAAALWALLQRRSHGG